MKVRDLMQTDVQAIRPDQLLPDAVALLADAHVTALAVVNNAEALVGVISTSDVLMAQSESESGPQSWELVSVRDAMTTPALTIDPDITIDEAAQHLLYADVHRLFVQSGGRVVGVISQTDIVRAYALRRLGV